MAVRLKEAVVEIRDVSFRYEGGREQLRNVNLDVRRGECVVVTGPSGSGKTTLTRLVNGLVPRFYEGRLTGSVMLNRRNAAELASWEYGRFVGSVFQDSRSQFFASIVEEEIALTGENFGMDSRDIRERVNRLGRDHGLAPLLRRRVHRLSGGEKQQVAVAAACFADPELLVMDEPSANLDMVATGQLARRLAALKAEGTSLLIAEHRLYYLLPLADRIVYMRDGEIAAEWTPDELRGMTPEQIVRYGLRAPMLGVPPSVSAAVAAAGVVDGGAERLSLRSVTIAAGRWRPVLMEHISLTVRKGEVAAIVGPNGAGKTTLAMTLCGLRQPRSGTILLDGTPGKARERLRRLAYVMQDSDYQLFADSVLNELLLNRGKGSGGKGSLGKGSGAAERAEQLLKELDLWELRDRHPASLSGGQKQRVAFAVALMNKPDILVLDEPTSGLDGGNMRLVVRLIRRIASGGVSVLVITHDYEFLCAACDRLFVLGDRKLQSELAVAEDRAAAILHVMQTLKDH